MEAGEATGGGVAWRLWALVPVVALGLAVALVIARGDAVIDLVGGAPPAEDAFDVRRVTFVPGEVRVLVRNPQREPLTIAVVTVDDALVPFTLDGPATLERLRSATIVVPYHWVEDEPLLVGITSSTGVETAKEVPAAVATPTASVRGFLGYGLIGLLVGVVPVALGLLWLPSLRRADARWVAAFTALTAGLLSFLGIEALAEALELQAGLPSALGGSGLVLLGVALSALGMTYLGSRLAGGAATGAALALLVAVGIGAHNFGEGLAIGTSFATAQLQLGSFLVLGFMIHNVTEGLGIAAPLARERIPFRRLVALVAVAGLPTIAGAWLGGYAAGDGLATFFFALAAGAAFQVVAEVVRYLARVAPGGLRSGPVVGGFLAGIAAMWATGLLVG
ncbi:MAG: metal transporter [Thermoleophilia bacterium]|nr:metal transporter [Thermoleophilia bacterium]